MDRLATRKDPLLNQESYQYDGNGNVTQFTDRRGKVTTDGVNPVQELSGTTVTANSLMGSVDEAFQRTDSVGARSFLTDALGSSIALADSTGTLQTQYTFDPFGNTTQSGSSTTNSFAYTGRELDTTGLYFYRARYYNSTLQRFISEDPLGFVGSGANLYEYADSSPMNLRDPLGLEGCDASCQNQIAQLANMFLGSKYNPNTNSLVIPQDTQTVAQTLRGAGYQDPGQWWNPFLYWDPIAHPGGDEFRKGLQPGSFHFREPYPPCPIGALNPLSCLMLQHSMVGRKTVLDQFHVDQHDPAVDPQGHIVHDVFHLPFFVDYVDPFSIL